MQRLQIPGVKHLREEQQNYSSLKRTSSISKSFPSYEKLWLSTQSCMRGCVATKVPERGFQLICGKNVCSVTAVEPARSDKLGTGAKKFLRRTDKLNSYVTCGCKLSKYFVINTPTGLLAESETRCPVPPPACKIRS